MIEVSIDRIALLYRYDYDDSSDIDEETYKNMQFIRLSSVFEQSIKTYKPNDVELELKGSNGSTQFYAWINDTRESLANISSVPYQQLCRFDMNPKRQRSFSWLNNAFNDFKNYINDNGFTTKTSQIDIAFDLIDECQLADTLTYYKPNVRRTALFNGQTGKQESVYYGTRSSSRFLRMYDKKVEQENTLTLKYSRLKKTAIKKYKSFVSNNNSFTHQDVIDNVNSDVTVFPFLDDLRNYSNFETAIDWVFNQKKLVEKQKLPASWRRLEIVVRGEFISDKVTFNDDVIYEYISGLHNNVLESISDPILRSITIGVDSGYVNPKEISASLNLQRRNILKYDKIVIYRDNNSYNTKVTSFENFDVMSDKDTKKIVRIITKNDDHYLRDRILKQFNSQKKALKDELRSYSV